VSKDILGVYRSKNTGANRKTGAQAHTPDPTKYHDASQERLEGESAAGATVLTKLPGNHGFSKLRGVIIPRSTPLGGSRGHNQHKPQIIHIDPGPYGEGGIVVDLAHLTPESVSEAIRAGAAEAEDIEDIALNAFASLAQASQPRASQREAVYEEEDRLPPVQMPDTYVVPKASPGGGQQAKRASFTQRKPAQESSEPRVLSKGGPRGNVSLNAELAVDSGQAPYQPPVPTYQIAEPVKVTIEIPGGHQFHVAYHDVVREGMTMVLVYDHDRPFQMVYFPPTMDDENGDPLGMALLVHAKKGEKKSTLFRVHSPGITFKHRSFEFCVLLIEKEKTYEPA
jgi:hypothetical protein